jgi:hypothetical protein
MLDDLDLSFLIPSPVFSWYQLFKDFQNILLGLIGFIGVIITLVVNAYLARATGAEAIEHQRKALRVALAEELRQIKTGLSERLEAFNDPHQPAAVLIAPMLATDIYSTVVKDIGLLQPDQAQAVIRAYATVRRLDLNLASHNKVDDKQYIRVVGSNAQLTCLFLTTAIQRVQLALDMFRPDKKRRGSA